MDHGWNQNHNERSGYSQHDMPQNNKGRWMWLYHAAPEKFIPSIRFEGLKPYEHAFLEPDEVGIFIETSLEDIGPLVEANVEPMVILRFMSPGYDETPWGDYVIYGGSDNANQIPDAPFVGPPGSYGLIPPTEIEILSNEGWEPLASHVN